MEFQTDEILKLLIAKDDHDAFSILFRKYYGKVLVFVMTYVRSADQAEDIAQEVFIKLWDKRRSLTEIKSLDYYIFRMAKNSILDFFRKAANKNISITELTPEDFLSFSANLDQETNDKDKEAFVRQQVLKMPVKRRNIFIMSRFMGLSNKDISDRLDVSEKTVKNQLYLATKELREISLILLGLFLV